MQDIPSIPKTDHATRWVLTGLSLSMLIPSLSSSIANVSLPALALAFSARFEAVQWVILAYLLPLTALIVSAGHLGDLYGRRRLLVSGIALFVIASAACAVAPTLWLLIVARAMQGTGAAAMMALSLAFVGETIPRSQMGRAMGLLGTMSAVGTALGPSLGGALIASVGWHSIFLVNIPLGIAALVIVGRHLPPDQGRVRADHPTFDWIGTALLAVALAAFALAMTTGRGHFVAVNIILLGVAAMASALFVIAESRVDNPLVQIRLIRDPRLKSGLLASAFVSTVMMTTLVVGPFYLGIGLGMGSSAVGLTLSIGPIVAALAGIPAGHLSDRLGSRRIAIIGLLALAGGAACLALLPPAYGVFGYLMPITVMTTGYSLFQTANNTEIMGGVSDDMRGVVSGLLNLSRNLGLVTGASAMGAVFALASRTDDITTAAPAAVAEGMRITYGVAVLLVISAVSIMMQSAMRSLIKVGKILLIALSAIALSAVAVFMALRTFRQHQNARLFEIHAANGINESQYVRIGGIDQWIQIRGQDQGNPVILCIHGGPGGTWLPVTRLFLSWERDFTLAFWDQRGAGKTLKVTGPEVASTMSIERMTQDGIEVAEHLRNRLKKEKILLLGHSFGSVIATRMAKQRPDLFHALVGTGQVGNLPRSIAEGYFRLQGHARNAHDSETLLALAEIGPPPFKNMKQVATFFEQAGKYQSEGDIAALDAMKRSLLSPPPNYSLRDEVNRFRGFISVPPWKLYNELLNVNLADLGPDFAIPIIFIQGAKDTVTPLSHAQKYFDSIKAPRKDFVILPTGGHFAVWSHSDAFLKELLTRVRPLAL